MKQLQALSGGDLGNSYTAKPTGEKITAAMLDEVKYFEKLIITGYNACYRQ